MVRGLLLLFGLVVCFLFGLLYGIDHDRHATSEVVDPVVPEVTEEIPVEKDVPEEPNEEITLIQSDSTPAYKAASALETIVTFFYEIIVEILYQISRLFY